jgi:hypothetical protein
MRECVQKPAHLPDGYAIINLKIVECALGHARIGGILRGLHNRDPAAFLDGNKTCGAVILHPSQHNADYSRTVADSGGAKQRINSRTAAVFSGSLCNHELVFLDQQMVIRRSDVNPSPLKWLSIFCQPTPKALVPTQPVDQGVARILWGHVLDYEDGSGKIARQLTDKIIESVQPSRRSPNDYDVTPSVLHKRSPFRARNQLHGHLAILLFDANLNAAAGRRGCVQYCTFLQPERHTALVANDG